MMAWYHESLVLWLYLPDVLALDFRAFNLEFVY